MVAARSEERSIVDAKAQVRFTVDSRTLWRVVLTQRFCVRSVGLLLLIGVALVAQAQAAFENEYAVVIEATTGETFVNCVQWIARNATGDAVVNLTSLGTTQRGPRTRCGERDTHESMHTTHHARTTHTTHTTQQHPKKNDFFFSSSFSAKHFTFGLKAASCLA
jgi:hypothetical protein